MSEVHITDTHGALDRANKVLAGIGNGAALHRAIGAAARRAANSGRAKAATYASEMYYMSPGGFKGHVKEKITTSGSAGGGGVTSVTIEFAGTVIPLIEFQTTYSGGHVFANVKKTTAGGYLMQAFTARLGGRVGIYERLTKKRFPIHKFYSVSAAQMMQDGTVVNKMDEQITKVFEERLEHEITRILNGW